VCSTTCGDGIPAGDEGCDDAPPAEGGDGCSATCEVEVGYECTGTPSVCTVSSVCGDGITEGLEGCDDGGHAVGDGCSAICTAEPGYNCTGSPSVCVNLCGNNTTDAGEECDDGNTIDLDGCSAACTNDATEIEPNEDGTPQTGGTTVSGNDFDATAVANANANGAFDLGAGPANVTAALTPLGDEDVFAITNSASAQVAVRFDIWNTSTGFGEGVACATSIDTVLTIRSAAGDLLAQNDDRNGAADRCSTLSYTIAPGATVYAHVIFYDDDVLAPAYGLVMTSAPIYCGDAVQVPGVEECDDGNSAAGDGCSATCAIETADETEPNEDGVIASGASGGGGNDFDTGGIAVTNATAQGVIDVATMRGAWRAVFDPAGDEDVYADTNSGTTEMLVTADTHDPALGLNRPCLIDTVINVRNAAAGLFASNDQRASGDNCSRVVFALAPGATQYLHVVYWNDNTLSPEYVLTINRQAIACGDGVAQGSEDCDDGNMTDTDACPNNCQFPGVISEVEANGTFAEADANTVQINGTTTLRASIGPVADLDTFRITAATATVVRAETFIGALGRCDATTLIVRLYDSTGTLITSDTAGEASGIGSCGALVLPIAAGTYYVRVEENGNNAAVAKYFLQVAFGDDAGAESEAVNTSGVNDTSATASTNLAAATESFVFGDHTLLTDADYYTITVPANSAVRLEVVEGDRAMETCEATAIDSHLQVFGPDGTTSLGVDDDDGRGWCSVLDGTGATARDSGLRNATASPVTWFVRVRSSGTTGAANQFSYRLLVTIRAL
jgi:cysteine-rich repeat protein